MASVEATESRWRGGFASLWAASSVSNFGDGLYLPAISLLAATATQNPIAIALATALTWVSAAIAGPAAGAYLDLGDKARIAAVTDWSRAGFVGLAAISVVLLGANIWIVFALSVVLGVGDMLTSTAFRVLVPDVVGRTTEDLQRANASIQTTDIVGSRLIGPPIGGFLFGLAAFIPFALNALSYLISGGFIWRLRDTSNERSLDRPRITFKDSITFVFGSRQLVRVALMAVAINSAIAAGAALVVLVALDRLMVSASLFGFLTSGVALGAVAGSALAARMSLSPLYRVLLLISAAAAQIGIGLAGHVWVLAAALVVSSFATTMVLVGLLTERQALAPPDQLGRIMATHRTVTYVAMPSSALVGGALASAVGLASPFVLAACLLVVGAAIAALPSAGHEPTMKADAVGA